MRRAKPYMEGFYDPEEKSVSEHSPEPWCVAIGADEQGQPKVTGILASRRWVVSNTETPFDNPDDADRVVACVNACEGIPTALLEALVQDMRPLSRFLEIDNLLDVKDGLMVTGSGRWKGKVE